MWSHQARTSTVVVALACLASAPARSAQPPALADVVARIGAYVRDSVPALANIVAVEEYVQRAIAPGSTSGARRPRQLTSDFLLVRYPGADEWMVFRDVSQVDGKPIRQPTDRLLKLFAQPTGTAADQAAAIAAESARYSLPGGSFAVTNPLVAVALLHPYYHPRLRFTSGAEERSLGAGVRAVRFQELDQRPGEKLDTLFGPLGRVRGIVFVDETSGRIVKTDTRFAGGMSSTTTTTFAFDARLGLMLPAEMRTTWGYTGTTVTGLATYGQFRRFDVQTETAVSPNKTGER